MEIIGKMLSQRIKYTVKKFTNTYANIQIIMINETRKYYESRDILSLWYIKDYIGHALDSKWWIHKDTVDKETV